MDSSSQFSPTRSRKFDSDHYLHRLKLIREEPSLTFLKKIHKSHLLHIPHENLDFHYGKALNLDIDAIYNKVVLTRRGGVSFELNGLLHQLLKSLGFSCYLVSVQEKTAKDWSEDFEHMSIIVLVDSIYYLLDVGHGDFFLEPKRLVRGKIQLDYNNYFQFDQDPDENWILLRSQNLSTYSQIYKFENKPKEFIQFLPKWEQIKSDEASVLRAKKWITQLFNSGRIYLTNRALELTFKGQKETFPILNEDEFMAKLKYHFGIDVSKIL